MFELIFFELINLMYFYNGASLALKELTDCDFKTLGSSLSIPIWTSHSHRFTVQTKDCLLFLKDLLVFSTPREYINDNDN